MRRGRCGPLAGRRAARRRASAKVRFGVVALTIKLLMLRALDRSQTAFPALGLHACSQAAASGRKRLLVDTDTFAGKYVLIHGGPEMVAVR
jgi:hypothetical protein